MDMTVAFIVIQTAWDMFLMVIFSVILATILALLLVKFQDKF